MGDDSNELPKNAWDDHAQIYDDNFRRLTTLHATDLIGAILPQIRSAKTILDIGTGTGAFGHAYLSFFPKGIKGQKLILSDLSGGMIQKAKASLGESMQLLHPDFQTKLEFRVEDATDLKNIQDDSVDLVVSVFGVFLVPDQEKVFEAIKRVLVDGGTFATAAWTHLEVKEEGFGVPFHRTFFDAVDLLKEEEEEEEEDDEKKIKIGEDSPLHQWMDPPTIERMLEKDHQFASPTQIYRSVHTITFENALICWNLLFAGSPMVKIGEKDPQKVEKAKRIFLNAMTGGDETVPAFTISASNLVVTHL
mmetsp:Transcript_9902/g.16561  ORF Transcript_9902/g.16561 Transcript_9902/m.16561 type:complete len:306 (-) Transcript_9902:222-1139(-)